MLSSPKCEGESPKVESGEVELIPGDEVLARVRSLLTQHLRVDQRITLA